MMNDKDSVLRVSSSKISSEIIEGEAIVINMDTGAYYSIEGVGAPIWARIQDGISFQVLIQEISSKYSGKENQIKSGVRTFLEELISESLIKEVPVGDETQGSKIKQDNRNLDIWPLNSPPFVAPQVKKYSDMEGLLLIDPIHDVGERGWPHAPDQSGTEG